MTHSAVEYVANLRDIDWPEQAVIVADRALPDHLLRALPAPRIDVDAGEELKSLARLEELADQVLGYRSSRPLTLVAVGGGSLGDALGFLASILWRGVDLWHVPTTLLAMVDSAHGGKTAVNLASKKNQLGTFYPAERVLICDEFLASLPLALREEGLVELIKALWLGDAPALSLLDDSEIAHQIITGPVAGSHNHWRRLLSAAIDIKYDVVAQDPEEKTGYRRILNLGHTAGHGLEAVYKLPHGRAIAWGLAACLELSAEHAGLSSAQTERLRRHLDPLLTTLPKRPAPGDRQAFLDCLKRDKKWVDDELISILLAAPGQPVQTRSISPEDWWQAVWQVANRWRRQSLTIKAPTELRNLRHTMPPGKSEANRAALIAHLRPGPTTLATGPGAVADDIVDLRRALDVLARAGDDAPVEIDAGQGGTTARFLMAAAALRSAPTTITMSPQLRNRPHDGLFDALRRGGAQITSTSEGIRLVPWDKFPDRLVVDASQSSQYASALALLAASGRAFCLEFSAPLTSAAYFELTLKMLEAAGVAIDRSKFKDSETTSLAFSPSDALNQPCQLTIAEDASSAVVWHAISAKNPNLAPPDKIAGQPDSVFPDIAGRLIKGNLVDGSEEIATVSLAQSPDLAPVLAALATGEPTGLAIVDAAHLRHKESDRIGELAAAFAEVGLDISPTDDGLRIPPGVQQAISGACFDPRDDHRLAMAAVVLIAPGQSLTIANARCVAKSYPDLWRHARRAGYTVIPADDTA